jgi:hypothetical protein
MGSPRATMLRKKLLPGVGIAAVALAFWSGVLASRGLWSHDPAPPPPPAPAAAPPIAGSLEDQLLRTLTPVRVAAEAFARRRELKGTGTYLVRVDERGHAVVNVFGQTDKDGACDRLVRRAVESMYFPPRGRPVETLMLVHLGD